LEKNHFNILFVITIDLASLVRHRLFFKNM